MPGAVISLHEEAVVAALVQHSLDSKTLQRQRLVSACGGDLGMRLLGCCGQDIPPVLGFKHRLPGSLQHQVFADSMNAEPWCGWSQARRNGGTWCQSAPPSTGTPSHATRAAPPALGTMERGFRWQQLLVLVITIEAQSIAQKAPAADRSLYNPPS
jgi:hypothetical protein